ncbi:MAG: ABC transporter permease [Faecousia sp.]|nr:ABC transporter permease [Bacillota bacterium]
MFESISQALQSVFAHKLRSFLTMLGIIIGIASIITIISSIKGTNEQIKENLIGAGNNVVTVQLYQNEMQYDMMYNQNPAGVSVIGEDTREELCKLDGVQEVSFYRSREYAESVYYLNTAFNGGVYGIDESYFAVNDYSIRQGRNFTQHDFENVRKVAILDETAAKTLFGSDDPVGKTIEIAKEPFTVVGIAVRGSAFQPVINSVEDYMMYAETGQGVVFLPESVWPIVYRFDEPQNVAVRATSTDDITAAGKSVADYLTANQIAEETAKNGFSYRNDDLLKRAEQLQEMSESTNNQLIWIAGISLLVGGIGVMNIMLVSVTERTHEIGLKKAIGAKRRRILSQFLTEAAVLTGIGGLLGVLGGIGMSKLISHFMDTPSAISIPAILAAAVFSILIGLIFGIVPAVKASKLNPIEALRRE